MEKLNVEAPGTPSAFLVIRGMRNEWDECINKKERSEPGIFNVSLIELGDKHKKLEDKIPMKTIDVHKEHGCDVDGTTHAGDEADNEMEAMEQLNEFRNQDDSDRSVLE